MNSLSSIWTWMRHEWQLELRQKAGIQGAILYVLVSLVVAYQAVGEIQESEVWVGLLWIVLLFSIVNSSSRSFASDSPGRKILLYFWLQPGQLILARMLYQMAFNLVCRAATYPYCLCWWRWAVRPRPLWVPLWQRWPRFLGMALDFQPF